MINALLNLLFPPKCPFCARVLDRPGVCPVCEKELPWTAETETVRKGSGGLRCAAPLWYEELAREGVLRLKFRGAAAAAEPLGGLIARCAAEQFSGEFDVVTWVPVSKKRLRRRGYDQARLLAESACRVWQTRPVRLLSKLADNPAQSTLKEAAAQRANVLGVYAAMNGESIRGKRVLLVDDICTTGATLTECIRVLKDAGAADVVCAAVALTRPDAAGKSRGNVKE
ncbi:ComF family protein [Oscillibacter sp.]|uniref:ComF family protein n=1 Tax=Oscillibacter sp. TaxID=1945593 RepID=UPI002621E1CC|nr:phosphoribosyltransferase family protein [Oscillibacter sp.]MDD3347800.1 phosphoribosyltransferase family protein [Oscillibacter sp.]